MLGVPLWSALSALLVVACALRCECKTRAALVLLTNWIVNTVLAYALSSFLGWDELDSQFCWQAMIGTDLISVFFMVQLPVTGWQVVIGVTYVVEIVCHTAFGCLGANEVSRYYYWWSLHYLAWTQAALLLAWESYDGGLKVYRDSGWGVRRIPGIPVVLARLGKKS